VTKLGVVGAGVMGSGVAQSAAQAGFDVALVDLHQPILERARSDIYNNLRLRTLLGGPGVDVEATLARIGFHDEPSALSEVDFVVENIVEKWEAKRELYLQIDRLCPAHCVFAANTSAISITRIASWTSRPSSVIGIHFMNPVPMKNTVEVIRGFHTSEQTLGIATTFIDRLGKRSIVVNDSPGFVSNRVLMLTINEAINLVQEQVAAAADIDLLFENCFGHRMGPLATADLIGLDTILQSLEVLQDSCDVSKYRPSTLLRRMVDAGQLGRKSGSGFFDYSLQETRGQQERSTK
jgi:3-hydroxybutyryl-CoA dehydrogenase